MDGYAGEVKGKDRRRGKMGIRDRSNAGCVGQVAKDADGALVGSALIDTLADGDSSGAAARAGAYIRSLASGTSRKVVAN